jgi:excisionase family DNA binding protein
MAVEKLVYTTDEFAELFGVCKMSVYNYIASGSLPFIKVGKRTLITKATVNDILSGTRVLIGRTAEVVAARNEQRHATENSL